MPKQVEPCLWCGDLPCTCNGPAVKPKRKIKPKPTVKDDTPPPEPEPTAFKKLADEAKEEFDSQDARIERQALANLVDILHEDEVRILREQKLIDRPMDPDTEARLIEWRKRHA